MPVKKDLGVCWQCTCGKWNAGVNLRCWHCKQLKVLKETKKVKEAHYDRQSHKGQ